MKRLLSVCLALALLAGSLPTALGAQEGNGPWEGLTATWNGNYYGYLNADGEWAIQPIFDSANPFDDTGHAAVMVDGKYGLIDHTGAYMVEPVYDYIDYQYGGGRTFQLDGTYGIMEADGAIRVSAIPGVDWADGFREGVARYCYGTPYKYGILDAQGQRITEPIYDWLGSCRGGMLDAMQDEKSGLVAKDGTVVLPLAYEYVSVEEGYIIIGLNGKRGLLDSTGREILPAEYDDIDVNWCAPSGLALLSLWDHFQDGVYQGDLYGVLRLSDEKIVVPCTFSDKALALLAAVLGVTSPEELFDASRRAGEEAGLQVTWYPGNGITRFYGTDRMLMKSNETGLYALCGLDGTNYTGYVFDAVDAPMLDGSLMAMKGGKWGKLDQEGNVLVDFLYDNKEAAKNPIHVQIVQKGGLFAIADLKGNLLTGYNYWNARDFVNGYAALQNNQGLWGYIDGYGNVAVPFRYQSDRYAVGDMGEDGFAIIQTFEYPGYRVVNTRGEELFDQGMGKIWRAGLGMWGFSTSAASGSGKVGFADSQGNIVVEPQYEYYTSPKGELYGGTFNTNSVAEVYRFLENYGYVKRYIDTSGAEVVPGSISGWRSEGLSMDDLVQFDGPYGFVNDDGAVVVPYIYEAVGRFDHGYASVRAGGVYGMLKNPLSAPTPEEGEDALAQVGLSVTWVETDNDLGVLGRDRLVTEYKILGRGGMMGHATWGDYGLRSADGELILPVLYGTTLPGGPVGDGYFAVAETKTEDGVIYTDHLGNTFAAEESGYGWNPPELDVYREPGPDGTLESGKYGYGDPWTGEKVLPAIYDEAYSFASGVGIVRVGEDRCAIDKTGARLFDLNGYGDATGIRFVGGRLRVQDGEKCGFVDQTGSLVIPTQWDETGDFYEGLAAVRQGELWGYIDLEGNVVVPCVLKSASLFRDGLAIVESLGGVQGILKHPGLKEEASFWAEEEVAQAKQAGYITPRCEEYQTFAITRLQFAELAVNWLEKATGQAVSPALADTFTDTGDEVVLKAHAAGIVQGVGEGRFDPGGLLTREQLATMLWRAMEAAGVSVEAPADLTAYTDGGEVASWATEGLSALVALGVMEGTGGNALSPKASCTVEQAILLAYRAAE